MNSSTQRSDPERDDFLTGWREAFDAMDKLEITYGVIALTNFGEHPVPSVRFAEFLGVSAREAETLAQQWGWPGTRVEDEKIVVDPERAAIQSRRRVQIGAREFGVSGCAPDIYLYAPLVTPSLQIAEKCGATGEPIRVAFTPDGVESVDPSDTVLAMVDAHPFIDLSAGGIDYYDANVCNLMPFFSSATAAQSWQAQHPHGRLYTVREAWDLPHNRRWRTTMSARLKELRP